MRICVIGAGISGLTAALELASCQGVEVTVLERAGHFGGRADVDENGEHCPRFFLDDYRQLGAVLRRIDRGDGRSLFDNLQPVRRFAHTPSRGWVEISHLYLGLAKEVSWTEKLRVLREWRRRPLVADRTANANRYGSIRNYSLLSLLRMTASLFTSKKASVLPGPTDKYLVDPWVAHLLRIGVELHAEREVTALRPVAGRVEVRIGTEALDFDAVVVTAFVPDLAALLTASGMGHRLPDHTNTHCVAFTVDLDLRERVLTGSAPRMYSRGGINILVQPRHGRCVVLCTTADSTAASEVMPLVRAALSLEYDIVAVRCRMNPHPREAVFVGTYLDPRRILRQRLDTVYFAGSATRNGYPMDSAEGAARTALAAVQRIARDHRLVYAPTSIGRPPVHARGAGRRGA